jgi:hypothetical protein
MRHGQVTTSLPTRIAYAWDYALVRELPEANAADTELAIYGTRPATKLTAVLATSAELGRRFRLGNF